MHVHTEYSEDLTQLWEESDISEISGQLPEISGQLPDVPGPLLKVVTDTCPIWTPESDSTVYPYLDFYRPPCHCPEFRKRAFYAPLHSPLSPMPPKRKIVDPLTEDETLLLVIAIRLYSAIHHQGEFPRRANAAWYLKCISKELVRQLIVYISEHSNVVIAGQSS